MAGNSTKAPAVKMTTDQIYALVNSVNQQAFGQTALSVTDTSTLISLGTTVLSSSTNTEAFLNTLAQRIGRTILRYREYRNKLGDMVLNDFEYGAILQKIKVKMPDAEADESFGLTNGVGVDHYKVNKPDVDQKLFVTRTPYQFHITIQRAHLKEAFLSPEAMGGFIGVIFGEVRNAIEISFENLGRVTLATAIAEATGSRVVNLVSDFNTEYSPATPLTAQTAIHNEEFLRYAIMRMNNMVDMMQDASALYNDGSLVTFTPLEDVRVRVLSQFQRRLETNVSYAAFHDQFVEIPSGYQTLNFWQAEATPMNVNIVRPSDQQATTVSNVIALIHDRDAMGIYKIDEDIATTPVNAAGLYYNQYWHEMQLRFVDLSENFVIFTLN